ncbi:MAG: HPP family protein [Gammaproteobacteria bacterium]
MPAATVLGALRSFAGTGANRTGHLEKWVSGIGGLAGILGVLLISQTYLGLGSGAALVASMGASAVLLFAVPHGPLSQPWAVFGGHLVSAVIGVACSRLELDPSLTAALAVALAISAMYYLRCIHPPGGATALTAVAGGESVHALGFDYVLTPVLLNVLVILSVAILFNLAFPWRRYPAVWARRAGAPATPDASEQADEAFSREDLATAAGAIDPAPRFGNNHFETGRSFARCNAESGDMDPADIRAGSYYCNGSFGPDWQVRRVIECTPSGASEPTGEDTVTYRVVAGNRRRQLGIASLEAFADWSRYEVWLNENSWQRIDSAPCPVVADKPLEPAITGETHEQSV